MTEAQTCYVPYAGSAQGSSALGTSLARSVEMSLALRSRSPWIVSASPMDESLSRAQERISSRDRSLSLASRYTVSTRGEEDPHSGSFRRTEGSSYSHQRDSLRNINDYDYDRGLPDEGRGLLLNDGQESSHSMFSKDEAGEFGEQSDMSTFGQTLFNAVNLLMGVGLLSLPYAMRLAGWFGVAVLLVFSALTCYTAKILGKIQEYVPAKKLRDGPGAYTIYGFHDMGGLVFGETGRILISIIFIAETFGYCCVYLIIEGENLQHQLNAVPFFKSWGKPEFMCFAVC